MSLDFLHELATPAETKIVLLVMDGLGGLAREPGGKTELETAHTPNLDALAARSALGLSQPAGPGITVGSGPGHLALFGFDPLVYKIGRGVMEALGVDFDIGPDDVAARGDFCAVDSRGIVTDRRAGRPCNEVTGELVDILRGIKVPGAEFEPRLIKEHRFAVVIRGAGLGSDVTETDPLKNGVAPLKSHALNADSARTAELVNQYAGKAGELLKERKPANMILLRGFDKFPRMPKLHDLYGIRPAAIAVNGMYRGVARLVGMTVLDINGTTPADQFTTLEQGWQDFDYFFIHIKKTDTCGEAGDFDGKVRVIEEIDGLIPRLMALKPDVVIVRGDHSSPAVLKGHSWHPVPLLIYSEHVRADGLAEFGEHACSRGSLGIMPAKDILPLALANARRLSKYGA